MWPDLKSSLQHFWVHASLSSASLTGVKQRRGKWQEPGKHRSCPQVGRTPVSFYGFSWAPFVTLKPQKVSGLKSYKEGRKQVLTSCRHTWFHQLMGVNLSKHFNPALKWRGTGTSKLSGAVPEWKLFKDNEIKDLVWKILQLWHNWLIKPQQIKLSTMKEPKERIKMKDEPKNSNMFLVS